VGGVEGRAEAGAAEAEGGRPRVGAVNCPDDVYVKRQRRIERVASRGLA
jgi:hypothetical protein